MFEDLDTPSKVLLISGLIIGLAAVISFFENTTSDLINCDARDGQIVWGMSGPSCDSDTK